MYRKVLTATLVGIVLSGTLVATTAQAATTKIANGVTCTKKGSVKKLNGNTYSCTINAVVSSKKLTWTTSDCVNANKQYIKLNSDYQSVARALPATLADLDVKIAAEVQKGIDAAAKADALDLQIKDWQAKIVEYTTHLDESTAARDKLSINPGPNKASIDTYNRAITSLNSAIRSLNAAVRGAQTAAISQRKVGKSAETMKTIKNQAVTELAQAKSGVDQALGLRKIICQKGL